MGKKGDGLEKKVFKVIGWTFCLSHSKQTNHIFYCQCSKLKRVPSFLLLQGVTLDAPVTAAWRTKMHPDVKINSCKASLVQHRNICPTKVLRAIRLLIHGCHPYDETAAVAASTPVSLATASVYKLTVTSFFFFLRTACSLLLSSQLDLSVSYLLLLLKRRW